MKTKLPKWLPKDVKAAIDRGLFAENPVALRLCSRSEMQTVWDEVSRQKPGGASDTIDEGYGIPISDNPGFVKGSGLHFLTLMLLPRRKLDKLGRMPPKERDKVLSRIDLSARKLKQLLAEISLVEKSEFHPSVERSCFDLEDIHADFMAAQEVSELTGIEHTVAYSIRPDGSILRHDASYPYSGLLSILDRVISWSEHYGKNAGLLDNLPAVRWGGSRAEEKSYLTVLHNILTLSNINLNARHYATILNIVFDRDDGGVTAAAVDELMKRMG